MVLSKYAFRDSQDLNDIVKIRIRGGQEPFDIAKVRLLAQQELYDIVEVCLAPMILPKYSFGSARTYIFCVV